MKIVNNSGLIILLALLLSFSGCIGEDGTTEINDHDYSELIELLDEADRIDYRELVAIMYDVQDDWNEGRGKIAPPPAGSEPGITATEVSPTSIQVIGEIDEGFLEFARSRGVETVMIAADQYQGGDGVVLIWDASHISDVEGLINGLLTEEERAQVESGDRTFFIRDGTFIIAGRDAELTQRAVIENLFPVVWIKEGRSERAAHANLEAGYECGEVGRDLLDAVTLRNRAKARYQDGNQAEALRLYEESLARCEDVVALAGKAQILGSDGNLGLYVSKCPMCGSDIVTVLSIADKKVIWSRHKVG